MKKILFIFDSFAPSNSMAAFRSSMLVKYFQLSKNFEITILTNIINFSGTDENLDNYKDYLDKKYYYQRHDQVYLIRFLKLILNSKFNKKKLVISTEKKVNLYNSKFRLLLNSLSTLLSLVQDKVMSRMIYYSLKSSIDFEKYDLIMSSYGPFLPHLIAKIIKKKHKSLFWIADFRDPVYQLTTHHLLKKSFLKYSLSVVAHADLISVVSKSIVAQIRLSNEDDFIHVSNGFDPEYLNPVGVKSNIIESKNKNRLVIALTGTYYSNTSLRSLFMAINDLVISKQIKLKQIHFEFYVNDPSIILRDIKEIIPELTYEIRPIISRHILLERVKLEFDLLIVLTYCKAGFIDSVPGKIYEYIGLSKFVLGIVNGESKNHELIDIIRDTACGFTYLDSEEESYLGLKEFISDLILKKTESGITLTSNPNNTRKYQYEFIVNEFIRIIYDTIG